MEDPRIDGYRKWEFLRRNQEFQKDYAALENQFPEWIGEYGGLISPGPSFYPEHMASAVHEISKRWWVMAPIHPSLSIPSQLPCDFDPPSFYKPLEVESGSSWAVTQYGSNVRGPFTARELRFPVFQIDIAQPLEMILAEVEFWIENSRLTYRSYIGPVPEFRRRRRARLEEYESYLKVWDLRVQGLTFEQIAFRLFPRQMKNEDIRDAMTKRMRSQFLRAKKLIEGEYKQIGG